MDAEDLFLREFLGIVDPSTTARHGQLDPAQPTRRRHLVELLRRSRRSLDDGRGVLRRSARRRCRRTRRTCVEPPSSSATRWAGAEPGLHPHLDGPVRPVVVGRPPGTAAGGDPAPPPVADQHLRRSPAGPARPSFHSPWSPPTGRSDPSRVTLDELRTGSLRPEATPRPRGSTERRSSSSTASCTAISGVRYEPSAGSPCGGPNAGSSSGRRPTGAGAASSRRGCTRSSRCPCSATGSTTRSCGRRSTGSTDS